MSLSSYILTEEVIEWVSEYRIPNPLSVTLSEKQKVDTEWIDNQKSSVNFRHFMNRLNQTVYGKRFLRYDKRLFVFPVQEGTKHTRHHLHLILELPSNYDIDEFRELICKCWSKTRFGYSQVDVKPMIDRGWLRYQLKNRSKSQDVLSSIDVDNLYLPSE